MIPRFGAKAKILTGLTQAFKDRSITQSKHITINTRSLANIGWWRGSVVRTSGFGWRTFPDLRLIYG